MSSTNQATVTLVGAGGTPPYSFAIVAGPNTTIPATLAGTALTVDATSLSTGTYSVELQVTDQKGVISTRNISVDVVDPGTFSILNRDVAFQPTILPFSTSVPLSSTGGNGAVTWSLLLNVTTLPGASISGSTLSFTLTSIGLWSIGLRATDSLGNTVTRIVEVSVAVAQVVSVVDGHARIKVAAPAGAVGSHAFTLSVADATSNVVQKSFNYSVDNQVSSVDVAETAIDHFWGSGDWTEVVYPIAGDLAGFGIGSTGSVVASNGLIATINANSIIVTGPPTSFGNAELQVAIPILQGTTQVATITREFTLVSYLGTNNSGNMTCTTRPYIVGEVIGLNPQRPYFNSPSIFKNAGYIVQVAVNNTLPLGLSLDSVTGLIYGNLLDADVTQTVLQYVDTTGTVQATVTIVWDLVASQFQLIDNLTDGQLQATYNGTLGSSSSALLTGVAVHRGLLPTGLSFSLSGDRKSIVLAGTPTQAGFYDLWIQVTNSNGQVAFLYKRLVVEYIAPLVVLTSSLRSILTNVAFSQTLHATGGTQPYTWAVVGGTLPTGVTLNANSGVLSGTPTDPAYNQIVTFQVTDTRGVTASAALALVINNTLAITTPVLPVITPGTNYTFQIQAQGGQGAYTWALASGSAALPGGFTLAANGVLSGATSLVSFSENIIVQVTDAANNTATQTYALVIGSAFGLLIDSEGVGPIVRGGAYNGSLRVIGNGIAPYTWTITPDTPNPLPTGFTLTGDASNQGATATLGGRTTAALLNDSVKVQVVDANGNSAVTFLLLDSYSNLMITTSSLPQATVTGSYSVTLAASGYNPAFTWSLDPSSPALPAGLSLSSGGVLSGNPAAASNLNLVFRVTDTLGDFAIRSLNFVAIGSTLLITTTSLPNVTAGVAYNAGLNANGGTPGYTWSISPSSPSLLPSGLNLNASTGAITGTTLLGGFSKQVTFRVTDSVTVYREVTLTLTVAAGIHLIAGPDYIASSSIGSLGVVSDGDVTGIFPRPNLSFYVVATNCISTTAAGFSFGLPGGFNATVVSISNGIAIFQLSGPFSGGTPGDNVLNFSVSDSGVNASTTFHWTVYPQQQITLKPLSGSLPTLFL